MNRTLNKDQRKITGLVKASFWNDSLPEVDRELYEECKKHGILMLPCGIFTSLVMPEEIRKKWEKDILQQIYFYSRYMYIQSTLPITSRYLILKGTSAAQYYPNPEYRLMGDIDIITRHEDYQKACEELLENGFQEIDANILRHREFEKNGITVEVHAWYVAKEENADKAKLFDELLMDEINRTEDHILPDLINGLTLVEHISHHLVRGLGLRQIIDWMMFVDKYLSDEAWPSFKKLTDAAELTDLTLTVTRMCELYLGLPAHQWCRNADATICKDLLEYVLSCQNFGRGKTYEDQSAIFRGFWLRHPLKLIRELQRRGTENWKMAKYPFARPFAWIWQGFHLESRSSNLVWGYFESAKLKRMFEALHVKHEHP